MTPTDEARLIALASTLETRAKYMALTINESLVFCSASAHNELLQTAAMFTVAYHIRTLATKDEAK